jgi:fibronectin-binding autotransporter adhesin
MTVACHRLTLSIVLLAVSMQLPGVAQSLLKTKTHLHTSDSPTVYGQPVTFTATISPVGSWPGGATPDGFVSFEDLTLGQVLGTVPVAGGAATLVTNSLPAGTHHIRATFLGSRTQAESTMRTSISVKAASTALAVESSASPSSAGQPITFTATVTSPSPIVPTGTVTFTVNGGIAATATVNGDGDAIFITSGLTAGEHTIVATFASNTLNFLSSAPASIVQHVTHDIVVAGADVGSLVVVRNARTSEELFSFNAFGGFQGGVRVAAGDVNGDSVPDIIVGTGPGGGSTVAVFDGLTAAAIRTFVAFPGLSVNEPVAVAAGDVNGDGVDDIIVATGVNGHVKAFSGANGAQLASFFAFPGFSGGVTVAAGDVTGDGFADVVVAAGPNGHVKVFDGTSNALVYSFFAYPGFTGGIYVATGDVTGDGVADIITGAGSTATLVKAFDGVTLDARASFFAFPSLATGVRVGTVDRNGDGVADIIVAPAGPPATVRILDGLTLAELDSFNAFGPTVGPGAFIGGSK